MKNLVFAQAKTTDALSNKLAANDKVLENIEEINQSDDVENQTYVRMGQELRIDTMYWAKIHKSAHGSNRGGHLPNLGQVGPAPVSSELGGSA